MAAAFTSYRPSRRGFGITVCVSCCVALAAGPALARSAPDLSEMDLRLSPSDVAAAHPPRLPGGPVAPRMHGQSVPEIVGEIDQVQRPETPNRLEAGAGPLGSLSADEGMLKELLENKTIPLFRVRMAPPF